MSDTPRTDAFEDEHMGGPLDPYELRRALEFARGLERELNSIRRLTDAEIKTIHDLIDPTMPLYEGKMLFAKRIQDAIFKDVT